MTDYVKGTTRKTGSNPLAYHDIDSGTIMIRTDAFMVLVAAIVATAISGIVLISALAHVWR